MVSPQVCSLKESERVHFHFIGAFAVPVHFTHKAHPVTRPHRKVPEDLTLYFNHHLTSLIGKKISVLAGGQLFKNVPFQHTGRVVLGLQGCRGAGDGGHNTRPLETAGPCLPHREGQGQQNSCCNTHALLQQGRAVCSPAFLQQQLLQNLQNVHIHLAVPNDVLVHFTGNAYQILRGHRTAGKDFVINLHPYLACPVTEDIVVVSR